MWVIADSFHMDETSAALGALRSEAGNIEGDISLKNSEIHFTRAQIPDV